MKTKADAWAETERQIRLLCAPPMPGSVSDTVLFVAKCAFDMGFAAGSYSGAQDMALVVDNVITPASKKRQA